VLLVGAEWRPRVLLRAELIEAGLDVVATDTWEAARDFLLAAVPPRYVMLDLQGLANPSEALRELSALLPPARVFVIGAAATVGREQLRSHGFQVLARPITIAEIVRQVKRLI
jgi:hypothetical protein